MAKAAMCASRFGITLETRSTACSRAASPLAIRQWRRCPGGADYVLLAVEKPVHIHDLHATALHMLGMDHTKLTYRYSGRDFRLTDVAGNVVSEILV